MTRRDIQPWSFESPGVTDHTVGIGAEFTHRNTPVILPRYRDRTEVRGLNEAYQLIEQIPIYPLTTFEN